eukprot:m.144612 g.144612  ORF g.144612 m.144612 type:complete len:371 (-) comp20470_c0_seq7:84-1196(-)
MYASSQQRAWRFFACAVIVFFGVRLVRELHTRHETWAYHAIAHTSLLSQRRAPCVFMSRAMEAQQRQGRARRKAAGLKIGLVVLAFQPRCGGSGGSSSPDPAPSSTAQDLQSPPESTSWSSAGEKRSLLASVLLGPPEVPDWPAESVQLSLENKRQYTQRHGYELVVADSVDPSRPPAWSKLKHLQAQLPRFDFLAFMDLDALIMNNTFKLEWLAQECLDQHPESPSSCDVIISNDQYGANSGVFMVRNSPWTLNFLQLWWDQKQLVFGDYQFDYEQRALHYLLGTDHWRKHGYDLYPQADEIAKHVTFVPPCAINSVFFDLKDIRRVVANTLSIESKYSHGDFLIHFAGHRGRARHFLMEYYAQKAALS